MGDRVSCSSGDYVAKDDFELRILCLENWAKGMHCLSYLVYVLLRIKPRALCVLGKHFPSRVLPPAPSLCFTKKDHSSGRGAGLAPNEILAQH